MKVPIEKIVEKAEDTLSDAVFNFESTRYEAAINRSYYAVFYCISALLEAKQANTKTHQGAHNKFNELYLKTKLLPSTLNTSLDIVFSLRANRAIMICDSSRPKKTQPQPSSTPANSSPPPKNTLTRNYSHDTNT
jgi:uncharacterized protein (UPF0332 family)